MNTPAVPEGFTRQTIGGEFIVANGPLYERFDAGVYRLGFRVEARHCNTMGICHGGMMATFCDMLLPLAAHRQVPQISHRFLLTISLQVDYLAPSPTGTWVQGEAQVLRTTRSLVSMQRISAQFFLGSMSRAPTGNIVAFCLLPAR